MFALRAAQLDLARQMETVEFIEQFIDFIKNYGYNALVLYLESRVKSNAVECIPDEECYTPEEMKRVIRYASERGIDVIPVVSNLGHTELFLKYKGFKHLSELREGVDGRFNNFDNAFCPSLEEVYDFTEKYFAELAGIFPSKYFHVGCDEVWNMGLCSICKERIKKGESASSIFYKHLLRTHEIVTGKLGKRMLIWDDMFDDALHLLKNIPKDIIMCHWAYDLVQDKSNTHFGQKYYSFRFAEYDRLGFEYLVCPAIFDSRNIETFTRYSKRYTSLGGLMTSWELSKTYMYEKILNFALGGELWRAEDTVCPKAVMTDIIKKFFSIEDDLFVDAVQMALAFGRSNDRENIDQHLRGNLTAYERERRNSAQMIINALVPFENEIKGELQSEVYLDIVLGAKREVVRLRLRSLVHDVYLKWSGEEELNGDTLLKRAESLHLSVAEIKNTRAGQYERNRKGISKDKCTPIFEDMLGTIDGIIKNLKDEKYSAGILKVNYFLPDMYSAQKMEVFVQYNDESNFKKVYTGQPKPDAIDFASYTYYEIDSILESEKVPKKIRFETKLYGGIGIVFVDANVDGKHYIPSEATPIQGIVKNSDNVLANNTFVCQMGENDTHALMNEPNRAQVLHVMEVTLSLF